MNKIAEHFGRRGLLVLISDLYEEPDALLEAIGPLRFRGHDMIVFHVLDRAELDFEYADPSAFEDLESGEQIPIVPEALAGAVPRAGSGAHHRVDRAVLGQSDRLHAREYVGAARPRAVQLPEHARAADADTIGAETHVVSHAALPDRACRTGHAGAAAPHSARAEAGRAVSVADVPAADSVPVRAAAAHPSLAAADDAPGGAGADRVGVRPAVLPRRRDSGVGCRRRARGGRSWSIARTAWDTAIAGRARLRPRGTPSTG